MSSWRLGRSASPQNGLTTCSPDTHMFPLTPDVRATVRAKPAKIEWRLAAEHPQAGTPPRQWTRVTCAVVRWSGCRSNPVRRMPGWPSSAVRCGRNIDRCALLDKIDDTAWIVALLALSTSRPPTPPTESARSNRNTKGAIRRESDSPGHHRRSGMVGAVIPDRLRGIMTRPLSEDGPRPRPNNSPTCSVTGETGDEAYGGRASSDVRGGAASAQQGE